MKKKNNKESTKKEDSKNGTLSEVKIAEEHTFSHGFGSATLLTLELGNEFQAHGGGYCSRGHYYSFSFGSSLGRCT